MFVYVHPRELCRCFRSSSSPQIRLLLGRSFRLSLDLLDLVNGSRYGSRTGTLRVVINTLHERLPRVPVAAAVVTLQEEQVPRKHAEDRS